MIPEKIKNYLQKALPGGIVEAGDSIERSANPEQSIQALRERLKPNDFLILAFSDLYDWKNRLRFLFSIPPPDFPSVSNVYRSSPRYSFERMRMQGARDWSAFLEARGLEIMLKEKKNGTTTLLLKRKEIIETRAIVESAESNRAVFNALDEGDLLDAPSRLKAEQIAAVIKTFSSREKVADLGCHTGRYMEIFSKVPGVRAVEGFDIAEQALEKVRQKGFKAYIWNAEKDKCPVEDGRYDVVIAGDIIEHLADTEFFLAEMKRILKPDGRIILTTPNLFYWLSRIKFLFARAPWAYPGVSCQFKSDPNMICEHLRLYGFEEWENLFKARGFVVAVTQGLLWVTPGGLKNNLIHLIDRLMPAKARFLCLFVLIKKE